MCHGVVKAVSNYHGDLLSVLDPCALNTNKTLKGTVQKTLVITGISTCVDGQNRVHVTAAILQTTNAPLHSAVRAAANPFFSLLQLPHS